MLIVDELKKNEPQLRLVALMLVAGLCVLFAGLWWVQVVSARDYQQHLETQSFRTVRLPAVRGKILDREGRVLAENRPTYNLSVYLDDLSDQFKDEYQRLRPVAVTAKPAPFWKFWDRSTVTVTNRARLNQKQIDALAWQARCNVMQRIVAKASQILGQPIPFDAKDFAKNFTRKRALPYPILKDLNQGQVARFQENFKPDLGVDLEIESTRYYPNGTTAGHLLGYVLRDDEAKSGESSFFNYYLPDYRGVVGVEAGLEADLRGRAGEASVLINSTGYRQSVSVDNPPEPGHNAVLTLDLDLQKAAEQAILNQRHENSRAAAVVMDVRNGDVLAMVSSPAINPDYSQNDLARMHDDTLRPAINRATQEKLAPGSIFKVIVGLAALEAGLNPNKPYVVEADPSRPGRGCVYVGRRKIEDTAPPGDYKFNRAIERSSNSYFIQVGLQTGIDRIIELAEKFCLGERCGLTTRQETGGDLPSMRRIHTGWTDGETANVCIGQGEVAVTPLQMAVVYSAIANGGTVFWPRLVGRIESQDPVTGMTSTNFPSALVRDHINVSGRSLRVLHDAMLGETEDVEGTGKAACVPGLRICGKTGTAQVQDSANRLTGYNFWFASFAPYENPRYAVVVMVQVDLPASGSGGGVCAPIAHDIYQAILEKMQTESARATGPTAQRLNQRAN
jgi:penicillin-binding protein 2